MTYDLLGFLPRDAMQARSLLSCSVCLSVRMSVRHVRGSRQNEQTYLRNFFTIG